MPEPIGTIVQPSQRQIMKLQNRVEKRMGESVNNLMTRNATAGKTVRHCSMIMDVSYSTAHRWANKYGVKFNAKNPFRTWSMK